MASVPKVLERVLGGAADANIAFRDRCRVLRYLGFEERTSASHHVFRRAGVRELINLQREGSQAKAYQVRQVRRIVLEYKLVGEV